MESEILLNQIKQEKDQLQNLKEEVELLLVASQKKLGDDVSIEMKEPKHIKRTLEMKEEVAKSRKQRSRKSRIENRIRNRTTFMDMKRATSYEFKPRKIKIYQ